MFDHIKMKEACVNLCSSKVTQHVTWVTLSYTINASIAVVEQGLQDSELEGWMARPVRWELQQGTKPPRSSWKLSPILFDESISNTSVVQVKGQPADQRLEGLEGLGACEFGVSGCVGLQGAVVSERFLRVVNPSISLCSGKRRSWV